jgi:hypothetical protein
MSAWSTPVEAVFAALRARLPGIAVVQLRVAHPADDDNVWFIRTADCAHELQLDSHPGGQAPFYIERDGSDGRVTAATVGEAVVVIEEWLRDAT